MIKNLSIAEVIRVVSMAANPANQSWKVSWGVGLGAKCHGK